MRIAFIYHLIPIGFYMTALDPRYPRTALSQQLLLIDDHGVMAGDQIVHKCFIDKS